MAATFGSQPQMLTRKSRMEISTPAERQEAARARGTCKKTLSTGSANQRLSCSATTCIESPSRSGPATIGHKRLICEKCCKQRAVYRDARGRYTAHGHSDPDLRIRLNGGLDETPLVDAGGWVGNGACLGFGKMGGGIAFVARG